MNPETQIVVDYESEGLRLQRMFHSIEIFYGHHWIKSQTTHRVKLVLVITETAMNRIVLFLFLIFSEELIDCYRTVPRTITLNSFSACSQDENHAIHFNGNIKKTARNKYAINGEFLLTDAVDGPIEVFITVTKDEPIHIKNEHVSNDFAVFGYRNQMQLQCD